jgi:peptidyl-prolyl cis-trans isomerase B (cyclophilin B)
VRRLAATVLTLPVLALAGGCGDDEDEPAKTPETGQAPTAPAPASGCRQVRAPEPKPERRLKKPAEKLDAGREHRLVVKTSCGEFTIALDAEAAPETAASLVYLAREGFYDGTVFHRVVPEFVVQGGDPSGTGSGGPGYTTRDAPPGDARYTTGVVAMAKTGEEPPGSAGSQFFVVIGQDVGLPPDYAIVGRVDRGLDVVRRIGALGDEATEKPTRIVVLEEMRAE